MKKVILSIVGLLAFVSLASADCVTVSLAVTNAQPFTQSDPIAVSGWLDKVEVIQSLAAPTTTVTLATYNATNAVDTLVYLASNTSASKVIKLRSLPTDNTGTALTASGQVYTNAAPVIVYDKTMVGGNIRLGVTANLGADTSKTNTVTCRIYFEPTRK